MSPVAPSPDAFERFGELLRYLRRRAGLSQRELAIAVGYSESQISRIEQGQRPPDTAVLRARFMPALGLDDEPDLAERLLALAAAVPTTTLADSPPTPEIALIGQTGLIATKLFCPHAHPHLVPRPQLLATLDAALVTPLTLVAAPAGFGKTTLLASWLAQVERRAHGTPELPNHPDAISRSSPPAAPRSAWLALGADDNDPATFLRYLVAALQRLAPTAGAATLARISVPLPPHATLLAPLINDLATLATDRVLVLDDYHLLTRPSIHQLVGFLLEHLPPRLHLVIATREEPPLPLARMRARRQLTELRAADLRFSTEEAELFLREVMRLPMSPEELAAVGARTEGWVAGLQLAALALKDRPDPAALIAGLTNGNRYLVDYLAEEVLERLPAHLRTFLVQTAILDRMCGSPLGRPVKGAQRA